MTQPAATVENSDGSIYYFLFDRSEEEGEPGKFAGCHQKLPKEIAHIARTSEGGQEVLIPIRVPHLPGENGRVYAFGTGLFTLWEDDWTFASWKIDKPGDREYHQAGETSLAGIIQEYEIELERLADYSGAGTARKKWLEAVIKQGYQLGSLFNQNMDH